MNTSLVGTIGTRAMLAAFGALGLDSRRIQAEAGFTDRELADPDGLLPADRFYRMWELANREWARPALGLHTGCRVPFGAYEVLDYLLLSSATVGEGLTEFARCMAIATRTARYEVGAEGDRFVCEMVWLIPARGIMFHLRDFSLSILSRRVAHAGGRRPLCVELSGPPLADAREYMRGFGVPTSVRAERNALIFSAEAWKTALGRRDDDLNRTLRRHAQLLMERQPAGLPSIVDEVRRELLGNPRAGLASIETVARHLAVSARTLQRRLREAGTSFELLSGEVRASLAKEYLGDRGLSISEVAYLVGFSELSAFSRAFRRWTGTSPQGYRAARVNERV